MGYKDTFAPVHGVSSDDDQDDGSTGSAASSDGGSHDDDGSGSDDGGVFGLHAQLAQTFTGFTPVE